MTEKYSGGDFTFLYTLNHCFAAKRKLVESPDIQNVSESGRKKESISQHETLLCVMEKFYFGWFYTGETLPQQNVFSVVYLFPVNFQPRHNAVMTNSKIHAATFTTVKKRTYRSAENEKQILYLAGH